MAMETLEERVTRLEEKVAQLTAEQPATTSTMPWWKKIVGVYRNDPEFDAAEELGQAYRQSLRPREGDENR